MLDANKIFERLHKEIRKDEESLEKLQALKRLKEEVKHYNGSDKIVPFEDIYKRVKNNPPAEKIYTGWTKLDSILKGIRKKHLVIWAGITKHGKTSLAMDLTFKLKDYNVLWLPIEESAEELIEKIVERGEEPPKSFAPENITSVDTDWIQFKIAEGKVRFGTDLVIIDNLSWVSPVNENKFDNKSDRIEQTVRQIKALCNTFDIPIILIAHVNKNSRADKNPTFEDLKGSSGIGQIADKAVLIWRETKRGSNGELEITNNVNCSVQLNRQGGVGNVKMVYRDGHFTEEEWEETSGSGDLSMF